MKRDRVLEGLLAADGLLFKVAALDGRVFESLEHRLFQALTSSFKPQARRIVNSAVEAISGGKFPTLIVSDTLSHLPLWIDSLEATFEVVIGEAYASAQKEISRQVAKGKKKPSFDPNDRRNIKAITRVQRHYIGDWAITRLADRIGKHVRDIFLRENIQGREAGLLLKERLEADFGLIKTPGPNTSESYFDGLAGNTIAVARSYGAIDAMGKLGIETYGYRCSITERTCDRCLFLDGRSFPVAPVRERMADIVAAGPEQIKELHPWARDVGELQNYLLRDGFAWPPQHFRCRCYIDVA